jgi:2-(1,2-epoxy-1,2-dihydrophenyl)acetyl-CoA isomerase
VAAGASCNLALACDLRVASEDARFIEAFARIGLVPDAGGGFFLPRLVGYGKALELAMLADEVSGSEAERLGLANKCVPLADFEETVKSLAQRLATGPTRTYGLMKELMNAAVVSDLETTLRLEGELQDQAFATADHREGVAAFIQKRPAEFTGK